VDPRLSGLANIVALHSRLFLNCLDGLSEETGAARPNERTNSIAFLAAHLVDSRHFLAHYSGLTLHNPFAARLESVRGIEELAECPTLDEARATWRAVTAPLERHLASLDASALEQPSRQHFPVQDTSVLGGIAFLVHHEAYHIGQLALLRKYFGAPAMTYR
jgi:uncharacterized damage-inducible protein DinB